RLQGQEDLHPPGQRHPRLPAPRQLVVGLLGLLAGAQVEAAFGTHDGVAREVLAAAGAGGGEATGDHVGPAVGLVVLPRQGRGGRGGGGWAGGGGGAGRGRGGAGACRGPPRRTLHGGGGGRLPAEQDLLGQGVGGGVGVRRGGPVEGWRLGDVGDVGGVLGRRCGQFADDAAVPAAQLLAAVARGGLQPLPAA